MGSDKFIIIYFKKWYSKKLSSELLKCLSDKLGRDKFKLT
jgi:hypothetical protein